METPRRDSLTVNLILGDGIGEVICGLLPGVFPTPGVGSAQVRLRGGDLKPLSCGELRAKCRCVWGPCLASGKGMAGEEHHNWGLQEPMV